MPMLLLLLSKVICLVSKVEARSLFPGDYQQVPRRREVGLRDDCARMGHQAFSSRQAVSAMLHFN